MNERKLNLKNEKTSNGYTIRCNYGNESLENCMIKIVKMVITQSLQQGNNSVIHSNSL